MEAISQIIRDCGRMRMADIASEIVKTRLASILRKENVRLADDGQDWQTVSSNYGIAIDEIRGKGAEAVVGIVRVRRMAALLVFLERMEQSFIATIGDGRPDEWGVVILRGQWLRETTRIAPGQPTITEGVIVSKFAFVRKDELPDEADKPLVVGAAS